MNLRIFQQETSLNQDIGTAYLRRWTRLILSISNGVYYQNYRVSFIEPWLGGKKPTSLSVSLYRNIFSNGQEEENRESTQISGINIGIGKRLQVPDDFFVFRNSLGFQQYKLENSQSFFSFSDGTSNDFNYSITLERESVDQITYPRRGSFFSLNVNNPPYSLFDDIDDYSNMTDRQNINLWNIINGISNQNGTAIQIN